MQPLTAFPAQVAKLAVGVFCDVDDTLTSAGKLPAVAYDAVWRLHDAGLLVVPVTGRAGGFCQFLARDWPVDGVIGEGGAVAFWEADRVLHRLVHPEVTPEGRALLEAVERDVLATVPGARVARDRPFRLFDLAFDYREEPPDLGVETAERIKAVFERHGAHAQYSSVHVNGWVGDYDKLSMARLFVRERWGRELDGERDRWLYCGDSLNDEPMFGFFPHACGVANVRRFADRLKTWPRYVTTNEGGEGFAELVDAVLALRRN